MGHTIDNANDVIRIVKGDPSITERDDPGRRPQFVIRRCDIPAATITGLTAFKTLLVSMTDRPDLDPRLVGLAIPSGNTEDQRFGLSRASYRAAALDRGRPVILRSRCDLCDGVGHCDNVLPRRRSCPNERRHVRA